METTTETLTKYKSSFYSVIEYVPEYEEYILFNTLYSGLIVLDAEDGAYVKSVMDGAPIEIDDENSNLIQELVDGNFFVDIDRDEQKEYRDYYNGRIEARSQAETGDIGLTVGTTITCNMGCPYCFEFVKPNKSLKDTEVMDQLVDYLYDMVEKSPIKEWRVMENVWYGGEPLLNTFTIEYLTPKLIKFCKDIGVNYNAKIITNGILLTEENWKLLSDNKVSHAQVTIDGGKETHNASRPMKNPTQSNYEKILENIAIKPKDVSLTIRVNIDKKTMATYDELMDDLDRMGVWPQNFETVTVSPSYLRGYEESELESLDHIYTHKEYLYVNMELRKNKLDRYNKYAAQVNLPKGKLRWMLPEFHSDECPTWVSPYHIVVDSDGHIHKCWETIHEGEEKIKHVTDGFDLKSFKNYTNFSRVDFHPECSECQYLPVCEKFSCSHEALKYEKPPCTAWKTELPNILHVQYVEMTENPDRLALPEGQSEMSAHKYR